MGYRSLMQQRNEPNSPPPTGEGRVTEFPREIKNQIIEQQSLRQGIQKEIGSKLGVDEAIKFANDMEITESGDYKKQKHFNNYGMD